MFNPLQAIRYLATTATGLLSTTQAMQAYQLLRLGSVILTSILLARSGLRMAEIGAYEALLYIGSTAAFFWANGLLQAIPPVYARLQEAERSVFLFNTFVLFSAIALGIVSVLWLAKAGVVPALTGLAQIPGLGWYCLYLFFHLATLPVEYVYLLGEKPVGLTVWGVASFGLYILALALPVYAGFGLEGGLMALAGLGALRCIWAVWLAVLSGVRQWRPGLIRQYLHFSTPLILNLLVGNLVLLFDSWLVGWYYRDEAIFAVFRYGSREFPLVTALATALGTAMVARIAADPAAGMAELKARTLRLFHLVFPASAVLMFVSRPLFPWLFNPAFSASAPLFNIYLLLTCSRVLLPNTIVLANSRPRAILVIGLLELAVKVVLGFCFVYGWGLPGLAWSAVVAFMLEKIGLIWFLEKRLGVRTADWLDRSWFARYVFALVVAFVLSGYVW